MLCALGALAMTGCRRTDSRTAIVAADATVPAMVQLPPALPLPEPPALLGMPAEPADNRTTPEKMSLGYLLFFDKRLSADGSMACEGCHHIEKGWASDHEFGRGHNSPTMLNVGYLTSFYFSGSKPTLEAAVAAEWTELLGPSGEEDVVARLNAVPVYRAHFQRAFGGEATGDRIVQAMSSFLRMVIAGDAPHDLYEKGDKSAISKEAARGFKVFKTAGCAACHVPPLYSDLLFHNAGTNWGKKTSSRGRIAVTGAREDMDKFRTPSLRNVTLTAPYFLDGRAATLDEAIDLMLAGGAGVGAEDPPEIDPKLVPVKISKADRKALRAFLESLTGKPSFNSAPTLP